MGLSHDLVAALTRTWERSKYELAQRKFLRDKYTFFISYGWDRFSREAQCLCQVARDHGHPTLIDHDWMVDQDERITKKKIEEQLRWAIGACQYILFFETAKRAVMSVNGPTKFFERWQEFELRQAATKKVVVLYHDGPSGKLSYGLNSDFHPYDNLAQAWEWIEKIFTEPDLFKPKPSGSPNAVDISQGLNLEESSPKVPDSNELLRRLAEQADETGQVCQVKSQGRAGAS